MTVYDGGRMCPVLLDVHVDGALIELRGLTASMYVHLP